jgi:hypothetical protein
MWLEREAWAKKKHREMRKRNGEAGRIDKRFKK